MNKTKIGFLPFYIKLYDDCGSGAKARPRLEPFADRLVNELSGKGFDVLAVPFCRIKEEFAAAVAKFEAEGCKAIVTWHAAYSPSLECIDALAGTKLPIVVLDTTETYSMGPTLEQFEISLCHGIHGVMDMCSMLNRRGKAFAIAAGHIDHSDVIDKTAGYIRAAVSATSLNGSSTGSIGGSFDGMGDFLVEDAEMLERFGVKVVYPEQGELAKYRAEVNDADVKSEMEKDLNALYQIEAVDPESHERTVRNCLAVRRWIEERKLSAMTVNFREITEETGLEIMPFMEACKAMSRGTGYAGEGDVLTASLVGSLMKGYDEVAFIEIFCPDWKGNTLLLSHMGEYNPNLTSGKCGMKEIPFIYGDAKSPVVSYGRYKGGDAVFINLYRTKDDFRMIISAVDMVEVRPDDDTLEVRVRGWMKPRMPIADFLEAISKVGATHHSALVYGARVSELAYYADLLGIGYDIV